MYFDTFADFLAMGHHGPYVWSAYGLTFAIVLWNVLQPWRRRRQLLAEQAALIKREQRSAAQDAPASQAQDGNDSPR